MLIKLHDKISDLRVGMSAKNKNTKLYSFNKKYIWARTMRDKGYFAKKLEMSGEEKACVW